MKAKKKTKNNIDTGSMMLTEALVKVAYGTSDNRSFKWELRGADDLRAKNSLAICPHCLQKVRAHTQQNDASPRPHFEHFEGEWKKCPLAIAWRKYGKKKKPTGGEGAA